MAIGLHEAVVEVEIEDTDGWATDDSNNMRMIVVEIALPVEDSVSNFVELHGRASTMQDVLRELMKKYVESKDKNMYFASYGAVLRRSQEFGLSCSETLGFLQRFFPVMLNTVHPDVSNTSLPSDICMPEFVQLTTDDVQILEYIGGFLLRKLYFHPGTPTRLKELIVLLKDVLRQDSVAYERNRPTQSSGERLWGIVGPFLEFLKESEMHFRNMIFEKLLEFEIDQNYYTEFFAKCNVVAIQNILAHQCKCQSEFLSPLLRKIFHKFTETRAHSYSKKVDQILNGKHRMVSIHGLRKYLKKYSSH